MRKPQVRESVLRRMHALLPGWRWRKKERCIERAIPRGRQSVIVAVYDYRPVYEFRFTCLIRLDDVEEIYNLFSGVSPGSEGLTDTSMIQQEYFGATRHAYRVTSEEDIEKAFADEVGDLVAGRVRRFFDVYDNVVALDAAMNGGEPGFDVSYPVYRHMHAVVVAYLAGNPRFDQLCAEYERSLQQHSFLWRYTKLVEHLKSKRAGLSA